MVILTDELRGIISKNGLSDTEQPTVSARDLYEGLEI